MKPAISSPTSRRWRLAIFVVVFFVAAFWLFAFAYHRLAKSNFEAYAAELSARGESLEVDDLRPPPIETTFIVRSTTRTISSTAPAPTTTTTVALFAISTRKEIGSGVCISPMILISRRIGSSDRHPRQCSSPLTHPPMADSRNGLTTRTPS